MSSSVARSVHRGATVADLGGVCVSTYLMGGIMMYLCICTLQAYVKGKRYVSQSVCCLNTKWHSRENTVELNGSPRPLVWGCNSVVVLSFTPKSATH